MAAQTCLCGEGTILVMPIHPLSPAAARAGVTRLLCVCVSVCEVYLKGFGLEMKREKGSFEEVTDGFQGTGQRKFARCWCRAAEPNFSPF